MTAQQEPNLFKFDSLPTFLTAYYAFKKAAKPGWSYRLWAKQLGLKSPSTLLMVLNGSRVPSPKTTARLSDYFKHTERERKYFHLLVDLARAKGNRELEHLCLQKLELCRTDFHRPIASEEVTRLLSSSWLAPTLIDMTGLADFNEDTAWIQSRLVRKFHAHEITTMLDLLERHELLRRDAAGILRKTGASLQANTKIPSPERNQALVSLLGLAQENLQRTHATTSLQVGTIFTIRREDIDRAKDFVGRFFKDFQTLFDSGAGDEVYCTQVLIFPLTTPPGEEDKVE
jgi:uncharacterized protein (TIGR02147 family)